LNDQRIIIGVDIRPTQITFAAFDVHGRFSSQEAVATPLDPEAAVREIVERIQGLIASAGKQQGVKIEGVGISVPGRFDPVADRLIFAPNLHWRNVDLRGPVAKATGLPVEIENAANACVLAAIWFDGMESVRNLIVLTVSEGIGAGVLVNGKLASGLNGMAGEFGHIPLDPKGPMCNCRGRGCWETLGSNRAALRYYCGSGKIPEDLTFKDLLCLADQGDLRARKALRKMAHFLGQGMRMIVCGLAPERILVVGDLTLSWSHFGPILEEQLQAGSIVAGSVPQLLPVHEGGLARLRGTLALVLQRQFGEVGGSSL
jgi:predicted NBD/HSP70 family sugar kinase